MNFAGTSLRIWKKFTTDVQTRLTPFIIDGTTAIEELLLEMDKTVAKSPVSVDLNDYMLRSFLPALEQLPLTDAKRASLFKSMHVLQTYASRDSDEDLVGEEVVAIEKMARNIITVSLEDLFSVYDNRGTLLRKNQIVKYPQHSLGKIIGLTPEHITVRSLHDGTEHTEQVDANEHANLTLLSRNTPIAICKTCVCDFCDNLEAITGGINTDAVRNDFITFAGNFSPLAQCMGGHASKIEEFMLAKHGAFMPQQGGKGKRKSVERSEAMANQARADDAATVEALMLDPKATKTWANDERRSKRKVPKNSKTAAAAADTAQVLLRLSNGAGSSTDHEEE